MRSIAILRFLVLLCFAFADNAPGQLPQVGQDTIFLRQGDRLVGKLTGLDGQSIRMRRLLPPLPGASVDAAPIFASVTVLRSHVDRVEFSSHRHRNGSSKMRRLRTLRRSKHSGTKHDPGSPFQSRPWEQSVSLTAICCCATAILPVREKLSISSEPSKRGHGTVQRQCAPGRADCAPWWPRALCRRRSSRRRR